MEPWAESALGVGAAVVVALVLHLVLRTRILSVVEREITASPVRWDDTLLRRRVPQRVALALPVIVAYLLCFLAPDDEPAVVDAAQRALLSSAVLLAVFVVSALLKSADEIYETHYDGLRRPITGYLQLVNILVFAAGAITIVSILADRSPLVLLGGLGALTAVLLLVFQDTITGFVASVQVQNYDLIRQGDWVEAPEFGADGEVVDLTLHTVKILNADRTMVTIPTVRLTQGGFTNWRPIYEGGSRRLVRSIRLDVSKVRFLERDELERFAQWELLHDYVVGLLAEHDAEAAAATPGVVPFRRGVTNVGLFRRYAAEVLRRDPKIHTDPDSGLTALVRVKEATPDGLPVEVYAFSTETSFEEFEVVQGALFDHLLAVVPEFGLQVFQNPTGSDMGRLGVGVTGPVPDPAPAVPPAAVAGFPPDAPEAGDAPRPPVLT